MRVSGITPGPAEAQERELLGRLGLDERATAEDVMQTHDDLQVFLAAAPRSLRGWARGQASAADEAFALLSDPTAWRGTGALPVPSARSAAQPGGPATPPVRRAISAAVPATAPRPTPMPGPAADDETDDEFEAMLADVTPSMHRERFAPRRPAAVAKDRRAARAVAAPDRPAGPRHLPRLLAALAGVVGLVAIVFFVYQLGAGPGLAGNATSASPTASSALDEAQVAQLMARIQADPTDKAALLDLGDAFFGAGEYDVAATWLEKLIALEPTNVRGLLALGATRFNLGDADAAKAHWLEALNVEPSNVEAHYDLGFLYLNQVPPDMDGVQREWGEVVRLAPGSDVANVVQQHLDALASSAPSPTDSQPATSSADPSAAASVAPSTAPTVAPSTTPSAEPGGSVAP